LFEVGFGALELLFEGPGFDEDLGLAVDFEGRSSLCPRPGRYPELDEAIDGLLERVMLGVKMELSLSGVCT